MSAPESIVCKPTPWFLLRALVMFLMFGVFTVLFYLDGSTGYRKKNESFFLYKNFQVANEKFSQMDKESALTPSEWKAYADKQSVDFGDDLSILPINLTLPMPWPALLHDFERMKSRQWNILWREYSKEKGLNATPPEKAYNAGKIREQWIVCGFCAVLASVAAFFLLRTLKRSISVDSDSITSSSGVRVAFGDLKTLDLRKWETKGLAFIHYDGAAGKGRIRIDGLTYGGFKKDQGEPAERLMAHLRSHFSGEIIEYTTVVEDESSDEGRTSA